MWKKFITLVIFYASFVYAVFLPANNFEANYVLKQPVKESDAFLVDSPTLTDVLLKTEKTRKELLSTKMNISDAFSGNSGIKLTDKYIDLLGDLEITSRNGLFLTKKIVNFCNYFNTEIEKLPISYEEKLKLRLKIDEIRTSTEEFGILLKSPGETIKKEVCDVLEINDKLKVVVLGSGFLDGCRIGMRWTIKNADNAIVTIVAVRPYASAAIVTSGSIEKIGPGMEANL